MSIGRGQGEGMTIHPTDANGLTFGCQSHDEPTDGMNTQNDGTTAPEFFV